MGETFSSVWNWAVTQFNHTIGWVKSLWGQFVDFLCFVKDSIASLLSSLRVKFCHSNETTSFTTSSATLSSNQGEEHTAKVEVHQRKTEFDFEFGNPPSKKRTDEIPRERVEQELKAVKKCKEYFTDLEKLMEEDLRASSPEEAEKTPYKIQEFLGSRNTQQLIEELGKANQSIL